jgi:RimJ/RimL family protein N-acetyltransferase
LNLSEVTLSEAAALLDRPKGADTTLYPDPFSLEVMELFVGSRKGESRGVVPFCIRDAASNLPVGDLLVSDWLKGSEKVGVGCSIVSGARSNGYASEALGALFPYLFARGIRAITASTFVAHAASRRAMEKAGMLLYDVRSEQVDGVDALVARYVIHAPHGERDRPLR